MLMMLVIVKVSFLFLQACPICQARIEFDMVDHIEVQHGDYFKVSVILTIESFSIN